MAYSSTNPLALLIDGFGSPVAAGSVPRVFCYSSTHNSTDILATGFFAACGDAGRSANNVGLRLGDIVINRASTTATIPGRVSMHSVTATTANVTSTLASSAFAATMGYDCSVSGNT